MWTGAQKPAVPTFHNHHKGSYARPKRVGSAPPGGRGARPSSGPRRDVAELEDALRERGLTQYARKFVHDQGFTSVAALLRLRPAKLEAVIDAIRPMPGHRVRILNVIEEFRATGPPYTRGGPAPPATRGGDRPRQPPAVRADVARAVLAAVGAADRRSAGRAGGGTPAGRAPDEEAALAFSAGAGRWRCCSRWASRAGWAPPPTPSPPPPPRPPPHHRRRAGRRLAGRTAAEEGPSAAKKEVAAPALPPKKPPVPRAALRSVPASAQPAAARPAAKKPPLPAAARPRSASR